MSDTDSPFWKTKPLAQFSQSEWEALCDGCGRCCLIKLEEEESGEIFYTDVACRLLDLKSCRCGAYDDRLQQVPDCLALSLDSPEHFQLLPTSCAYYRLYNGLELPDWHPLVSHSDASVHESGHSVRYLAIPETEVDTEELEDHIIEFEAE